MMKKTIFFLLTLLLLVLFGTVGIPFLLNRYLNANASDIVSKMITKSALFDGHRVEFGRITVNYNYRGTYLDIEKISLIPGEEIPDEELKVSLRADLIRVSGFKWYPYLFKDQIKVDTARIGNLDVIVYSPPLDSLFASQPPSDKPSKKGKNYELIEVGHVALQDFDFKGTNTQTDSLRTTIRNLSFLADGFYLDQEIMQNKNALFSVGHIQGNIEELVFHFDQFRQFAAVQEVRFDTNTDEMIFGKFNLKNKLDKFEYTAMFPTRQTWIELQSERMSIQGVRLRDFLERGVVEVDTVRAKALVMDLFMDKRIPEDLRKRPQMFHEAIRNLQQEIHINHLFLEDSRINIEERPGNDSPRNASMYFDELNAHIVNLSNFQERIIQNKLVKMDATAKVQGEGLLSVNLSFDLESTEGYFTMRGTLRQMNLRSINSMLEPEAKASIRTGRLNRLDFNIAGNDYEGTGELIVRFDDLNLELLNQDFGRDNNILRKIGAFAANKFIIKSSNPKKNGELRVGNIYHLREAHKSMPNYWWKMIFSGLKSTVTGESMEEMKQKAIAERAGLSEDKAFLGIDLKSKSDDEKEAKKEEREKRREERQARRQERRNNE